MPTRAMVVSGVVALAMASGCEGPERGRVGQRLDRRGDEIMVCGQPFHTGTPVVLWTDPGGYDAYRVERRFGPIDQADRDADGGSLASPVRFSARQVDDPALAERVRAGAWTLDELRGVVDQFVIHYDACGTSRACFRILHDVRGLSVHFLLDVDGTIYQTLDLRERAWHATKANSRSIGVEIANIGAFPPGNAATLDSWYTRDAQGTRMTIPGGGDGGVRTPGFIARPARDAPVRGVIHGRELEMYDLTDAQYDALIRLTAALTEIFPKIACDYPRDERGRPATGVLSDEQWQRYRGLLGHHHVQSNKVDPGPAFDWDRVIDGARAQKSARSR